MVLDLAVAPCQGLPLGLADHLPLDQADRLVQVHLDQVLDRAEADAVVAERQHGLAQLLVLSMSPPSF